MVKYQFTLTATPPIMPWPYATFAECLGRSDQCNQRKFHNVYKTELTFQNIRPIRAPPCINAGDRSGPWGCKSALRKWHMIKLVLEHKGEIVAAVTYNLVTNELFAAEKS